MARSLGATIYERHLASQEAQRQELERRKVADREAQQVSFDQTLALSKHAMDRKDKEFGRHAKLAELYGSLASQEGMPHAATMADGALQEVADLSFGLERQRIPQLEAETNARNMFRAPLETLKTERELIRQGALGGRHEDKMALERDKMALKQQLFGNLNALKAEQLKINRDLADSNIAKNAAMVPLLHRRAQQLKLEIQAAEREGLKSTARELGDAATAATQSMDAATRAKAGRYLQLMMQANQLMDMDALGDLVVPYDTVAPAIDSFIQEAQRELGGAGGPPPLKTVHPAFKYIGQ